MNVRIYSVHIGAFTEEEGWTGRDVVNVALTDDAHSVPEAMMRGMELCKEGIAASGRKPAEKLRVHEVRFIAEGQT